MRKLIVLIFCCISFGTFNVYATSNYVNDYTLIDCENGDDSLGMVFDSSKPYKTINEGIEKTIEYINNNVNKEGNENIFSGGIFKVKVSCSLRKYGISNIDLNFSGDLYNNFLQIEGIGDNGLIIQDTVFNIRSGNGNIIFKNSKFLGNTPGYYFLENGVDYSNIGGYHITGIVIENSYIKLNQNTNLGYYLNYGYGQYSRNNQFYIKNSTIDIDVGTNYIFHTPVIIKDSKINFVNLTQSQVFDVTFSNIGYFTNGYDFTTATLISNEIDMGGNNFYTVNDKNIAFINNKISNFQLAILGAKDVNLKYGVFINNLFDNISSTIDISNNRNIINNVFSGIFVDNYDVKNLRKNFNIDNIGPKGIGWIFKKSYTTKLLQINYTSSSLYKEVTGQDIPDVGSSVYAIFNW